MNHHDIFIKIDIVFLKNEMKDCAESVLVPADKPEKKKDERSFNYTIK